MKYLLCNSKKLFLKKRSSVEKQSNCFKDESSVVQFRVRINEKFGDCKNYEPPTGSSFAPRGPGATCYKTCQIFSKFNQKSRLVIAPVNMHSNCHLTKEKFFCCKQYGSTLKYFVCWHHRLVANVQDGTLWHSNCLF